MQKGRSSDQPFTICWCINTTYLHLEEQVLVFLEPVPERDSDVVPELDSAAVSVQRVAVVLVQHVVAVSVQHEVLVAAPDVAYEFPVLAYFRLFFPVTHLVFHAHPEHFQGL